jgi:hypothetical protein
MFKKIESNTVFAAIYTIFAYHRLTHATTNKYETFQGSH